MLGPALFFPGYLKFSTLPTAAGHAASTINHRTCNLASQPRSHTTLQPCRPAALQPCEPALQMSPERNTIHHNTYREYAVSAICCLHLHSNLFALSSLLHQNCEPDHPPSSLQPCHHKLASTPPFTTDNTHPHSLKPFLRLLLSASLFCPFSLYNLQTSSVRSLCLHCNHVRQGTKETVAQDHR